MKLRIACVQFSPVIGKVEQNIAKLKRLVSKCNRDIDLLVLPELSITGYNFHSPKDLEPYLEQKGRGRSFSVASELSEALRCTTVIGYPETSNGITYNSAMVVDRLGNLVSNYRKTHMYEADEVWGCSENPDKSFPPVTLNFPGETDETFDVLSNIGICMDLNPKQFKAPFGAFEFSLKTWQNDSSLIIVPTAWLSSDSPCTQDQLNPAEKQKLTSMYTNFVLECQNGTEPHQASGGETSSVLGLFESASFVTEPWKRSKSLIDYWIVRFFPYLSHPNNMLPKKNHKTTVVLCNRSGVEDDIVYGGSSCILQFDPTSSGSEATGMENPSVKVLASAGQVSEEVVWYEVDL